MEASMIKMYFMWKERLLNYVEKNKSSEVVNEKVVLVFVVIIHAYELCINAMSQVLYQSDPCNT
jgi:hypothetical protein